MTIFLDNTMTSSYETSSSYETMQAAQDWRPVDASAFTSKGALSDLEDATQFVLMMTEELNDLEADECYSEYNMDLGFILGEEAEVPAEEPCEVEEDLLPTPIDINRMHVVSSVYPSKDLLGASELQHLQGWVDLLRKVPQFHPKSVMTPCSPVPVSVTSSMPGAADDMDDEADTCDETSTSGAGGDCSFTSVSWKHRFNELVEFRNQHGHVNVPYDYPPNPPLAQWVKRQRHQYRLLQEGRHSNLTPFRLEQLESIDYCWDSREAHWLDRFYELEAYWKKHGHIRVSKRVVADRPLAVWLKRQRHQGRLYIQGKRDGSNMTESRLQRLLSIGVKFTNN